MILKMSAFNVLSPVPRELKSEEKGILTIDCSEMDAEEGYLQLSICDSLGVLPATETETPDQIPLRHHSPSLAITNSTYELCAFYKHQDQHNLGKLDVIFLYNVLDEKDEFASCFQDVKLSFSRPERTLSIALKHQNN